MIEHADTGLGWWADRPERRERESAQRYWHRTVTEREPNVWRTSALIVGLVLAMGYTLAVALAR